MFKLYNSNILFVGRIMDFDSFQYSLAEEEDMMRKKKKNRRENSRWPGLIL